MSYQSPLERKMARHAMLKRTASLVLLGIVLLWLDSPLHALIAVDPDQKQKLESRDWYQMFRTVGYLPTWLFIAGTVALWEWRKNQRSPIGSGIIAGAVIAGLLAELLKVIIGRQRPDVEGQMEWNPLLGAFWNPELYGSNLGLPSSHVAVAFGAAFVVRSLLPGAGSIAIFAACGCAATRLLAGAHAATDVYLAILIAWVVAHVVCRIGPRRKLLQNTIRTMG